MMERITPIVVTMMIKKNIKMIIMFFIIIQQNYKLYNLQKLLKVFILNIKKVFLKEAHD